MKNVFSKEFFPKTLFYATLAIILPFFLVSISSAEDATPLSVCPVFDMPPDFCIDGTIVYMADQRDENGCSLPPTCNRGECTGEYEPVCGEVTDAPCSGEICADVESYQKTFSNMCLLEMSGRTSFLHNGRCTGDNTCPDYEPTSPDWCAHGTIVYEDVVREDGCPVPPKCVTAGTNMPDNPSDGSSDSSETQESQSSGQFIPLPPAGFEDEVITSYETYDNPFPDTNLSLLEGQSSAELYRRGVIGGFPDGKFHGYRSVSRAGAAKFLLLARYETVDENLSNNGKFQDVLEKQWYVPYVVRANQLGIIDGYGNGNFGPGNQVKVGQFLKMLSKTFDISVNTDTSKDPWFSDYLPLVDEYDLFPEYSSDSIDGYHVLTRDEVSVAIYQYLKNR